MAAAASPGFIRSNATGYPFASLSILSLLCLLLPQLQQPTKSADLKIETDIRVSGYVLTARSDIRGMDRANVSFGLAHKVKDVRIKFEKIKRLLLKVQYESLIVCREKENNGLLCPIEDFRTSPLGQHYSDRFKFYIGIDTETKEPALGFQDGYGFVKKMSKMEHSYPDHITKAVKVLEKAIKASKMAPSTPSVKTRVWHEVIIRTNFSKELMLLVLVYCPEESSADDLKNLKKELTEFFQNGEGKQCRVVSLYIKAINTVHAQKVWGCSKDMELIMGTPFLEETLLNFKLHLSPSLEISQNRHTIKAICNGAEELLCPLDKTSVLIVGCSIGVYGFCMSKIAGEVLCVDTHDLIEEAKKNAKLNSITNCQFFGGNYKSSIIEAAKKITCAESCAIVVINDDNLALVSNSAMIKLRQIESLKRIVLVLELSNSRFNPIYQLSIPNFNNDLCSPFFPIRAIPVDSAPSTNSYTVLILMERIELTNLPSFSKDMLDSSDRNASVSLNPYERNLDSRAPTVAGSADNPSAVMEQWRLIEEQQRRYLVEEQIQNRLLEKERREQLEKEHQKRRFEEEQQIILLQEECQKRLIEEEHQRRQIEEGLQMRICEREQLKKNARGTYQWVSFEAKYQRFLLAVEYQRNALIEEQQRRRLEEEQRRRRLREELQRRVMEDKQQMRLFEEAQQRRQLEEKWQIRQFEEEKSTRFTEWQRRKLEEKEFLGRQLKEEEFQRTQLDDEEWQRRQLEGEWQVNRSEEQQRCLIKGEWQVRQVEERQKKPVEEEQLKRQLETEQKMRPLEEEQKKDQLGEEQKKRQTEEEQIRLEKERQWKLIEGARLKKRLVEEVRKQLLEEEQQRKLEEEQKRKQLEEEEKKKRLEKEKQKKKLEEERKKRELEEKRKKRNLEEERKRRKRLEEEQKRKKLEDEREKRKLEDERRKRKLEEGKRKREFEEKQKKPRWEEEREHVSQRSKDDAIVALISNTLKESGVTQLSADIAEKLKQVLTEAMKSVGVLGEQNIGTGHAAEQYSQNMRGNEQRGAQQVLAKAMTSVGVLGQQNIDTGHTAKQYSQNMRGDEQRRAQQVLDKAMTSVGVVGQQNIDTGHTAKQYSQNMHGDEQRRAQQVLDKAMTSVGVLGQQNIDTGHTAKQYSQNMRGDEQREGQQSSGIAANTYVRYEHLVGASKRDSLNKYTRSEWQHPVISIQNRNTSDIPDWNNKTSDSKYSCGVTSIQNINASDTKRYVLDWNNKSSDGRYSCENNTYSQGKLNTTDNKYNYGDSFDLKQLSNTGEVSAEFKFGFKNEGYNSLNNVSQNMTDDRYNKDHYSEIPSSSMNQDISSVRFSFKDTLSQTLQDRESKIDLYRIDSAPFDSWKDSFSPVSESQENPFRSYWNQKRKQTGPEKN